MLGIRSPKMRFESRTCIEIYAEEAYSASPDRVRDRTFVVLFAEVFRVDTFVRKVGLSTKSNKSTYIIYAPLFVK